MKPSLLLFVALTALIGCAEYLPVSVVRVNGYSDRQPTAATIDVYLDRASVKRKFTEVALLQTTTTFSQESAINDIKKKARLIGAHAIIVGASHTTSNAFSAFGELNSVPERHQEAIAIVYE